MRVVAGAARVVRAYAGVAAVAAAVVAAFLLRHGLPDDAGGWTLVVVGVALAAWPPVLLFLLAAALRALAELPGRLLATPAEARGRADELRRLAEQIRAARGSGLARLPLLLWRFARAASASGELLAPHAAVLPLASLAFLGWAAAAAVAAAVEIPVALVLLVVAVAS